MLKNPVAEQKRQGRKEGKICSRCGGGGTGYYMVAVGDSNEY
jgi:hypothetical protein